MKRASKLVALVFDDPYKADEARAAVLSAVLAGAPLPPAETAGTPDRSARAAGRGAR